GWYFAVHSLFTAAMLTLVLADNLLLLYVAWELVGVCSYLLIGFYYERRSAAEAAKKAFITTRVGDVGLLIGILVLVLHTGTFDIVTILERVTAPAPGEELSNLVITGSALLLFLGAMGKSAQFPLHVWLPDAMEGPTPVSALIHAATMVAAGVFLVARMLPLFEASDAAMAVVAIVGIATALLGATLALVNTDLKRILAYSTMSHLGFMMLALGAGAYTAALFHLLTHGIAKAMLFLSAGSIMHAMHDETDIRRMGGLVRRMPLTAAAFTLGALALAGIPPLSAFWSKDEIVQAVANDANPAFAALLFVAIVLSAVYMVRAIRVVFFGALSREGEHANDPTPIMAGPLAILAMLTLVVGFLALPIGAYRGIGHFLFSPEHGPHDFEFGIWSAVATVLAVAGAAGGWWLYDRRRDLVARLQARFAGTHRLIVERYYLDAGYQWLVDRVVLPLGRVVARFDRRIVNDGGVNGSGWIVSQAGARLRYHVTGFIADYGLAVTVGAVGLGLSVWLQSR
ncbi:MAG: NADH-quinone oxidoreductase subunit L, partial [SAR202 cluster bacterium]|nr:NADH-quinone oxidoreductase subunit L [SAR202 cluster bacterium]